MDEIGLIAPGPPGFFPRMVLNHSQWNLAHMELHLFSFCIMQKKENVFFFPKRFIILHLYDYLPLIHFNKF